MLTRRLVGWAFLADFIPLYPLYALFFTDRGLSTVEISVLFAIWSAVSIIAEVPTGALADRFSRRGCLVAAGLAQAAGYAFWVLAPSFAGFAVGFVLWGLGGVLASGAREALLHDGLAADGAADRYATVNGWVVAAGLIAEVPTALVATLLFAVGNYELVGWVSIAMCVLASGVALTLPEHRPVSAAADEKEEESLGYFAIIVAGLRLASRRRGVLALLLISAALGSFDALEEYFPLITVDLQVPVALVPLAMLPISLAGAAGAAFGGQVEKWSPPALGILLSASMALLAGGVVLGNPGGLLALAAFYGIYRSVLIVVDARLQHRIDSSSRATVTSIAGMVVDLMTFLVYAAWVLGGAILIAAIGVVLAVCLAIVLHFTKEVRPDT